jgi:hypothetical protein
MIMEVPMPTEVCSPNSSGSKPRDTPMGSTPKPVSPGVNVNPSAASKSPPAGKVAARPSPIGKSVAPL